MRIRLALCFALTALGAIHATEPAHPVETWLLNPRLYPDDARRPVKPPGWDLFGNQTHFTSVRGFSWREGSIENCGKTLDQNVTTFDLGDVIWPRIGLLEAKNLPEVIAEIKRRNLFLYQIWGYVPGAGSDKRTPEVRVAPEISQLLESQLGERWLGMDMGEQDGRYVMGFSRGASPISDDRLAQYLNFHRYMEGIANDSGHKMSGLSAVSFSHYLGKEGIFTMLGAETAQEHPNAQVFYSFIRGAGKQYGVPWFGNASVFNRWGWKEYKPEHKECGPTKGTSLALMKRLLYTHVLYNCMIAGFENGWLANNTLTPIGQLQQSAQRWVRAHGQPGVMQTPIALMTDFGAGWIFPSYNHVLYRVWGNLPYGAGDYLTNNVLGLLYPGYQDSSFFHDETGFATETPYGDAADVLLSDAPGWVLARYPLLVIAGELNASAEIRDKLQAYVEQGGTLYITAGSLKNLPGGLGGVSVSSGPAQTFEGGQSIRLSGGGARPESLTETEPFELLPLNVPKNAHLLAQAGDTPAAVSVAIGKGNATVFACPFGLPSQSVAKGPVKRLEDRPLVNPFPMLAHVRTLLDTAFRRHILFEAGDGLAVITCRRGVGDYTLGISNNALAPRPLQIISYVGSITSIEEIPLDQSEKTAVGFLPEGFETATIGQSDAKTIAGGDIRIFRVRVAESGVTEMLPPQPPVAPHGRLLAIRKLEPLQEQLLSRPTFFQHFDGVVLDWKYVAVRDKAQLEREAAWLGRQKVRVVVDFTSGLNLFPDLRLVNNLESAYQSTLATLRDVFEKMPALGASDVILSLSISSETEAIWKEFERSIDTLCGEARTHGITIHLRNAFSRPGRPDQLLALADRIGAPNLKLALATGPLLESNGLSSDLAAKLKGRVGFWLISTPQKDIADRTWTTNAPLSDSGYEGKLATWLRFLPDVQIVADAAYRDQNEEYRDAVATDRISNPQTAPK